MSTRVTSWLAWSLAGLSVIMFLASIVLTILALLSTPATQPLNIWGNSGALCGLVIFVPFLTFPLVGSLIASRHPTNAIGWVCLAVGFIWMLIALSEQYEVYALARFGSVPGTVTLDAATQWIWIPPVGLLGIYLPLLFPDGKLPSRRWRSLAWLSGVVMVLASLAITFSPGPLEGHPGVRNPFGLEGVLWMAVAAPFAVLLVPLCIIASALSLVIRYRRSRGEERQQIKWIAFAAMFVGPMFLITMISSFIFPSEAWFAGSTPLWLDLLQYAALMSFTAIPIAVGIAILRHRLYDIDLLINRTLVYGALTATLVAVYFGGVAATQGIFRTITGHEQQPQLAVVVSTLVIAALFNPLRRGIQAFIDRRFYRRRYDARQVLDAFSSRLRDETNLDVLKEDLARVVKETMQPTHVSLWLQSTAEKSIGRQSPK